MQTFYKFKYQLNFFFLIFFLSIITVVKAQTIRQLIQPLNLSSGKTDSVLISDMFYANLYKSFKIIKNPVIDVKFNYDKTKLILIPKKTFQGISLVDFEFGNKTYEIPIRVSEEEEITFTFKPEKHYSKVYLFGSFNSWTRSELEMKYDNGTYRTTIMLEPGRYQYKFFADGKELIDPKNPEQIPNGMGGFNSVLTIEPKHKSQPFLQIKGDKLSKDKSEFSFVYQNPESSENISNANIIILLDNNKINPNNIKINGDTITVSLNKQKLKGEKTLRIAVTQNGQATNIQYVIMFDGIPAGKNKKHFTWHDAIIYNALIDRFSDGDKSLNKPIIHDSLFEKANYIGGDFQGIINKFNEGYFDSLGITTLWISPVYENVDSAMREFPAPHRWFSGYHGYWPVKPRSVETEFGTMAKLKELIKIAHKHNVKVLLDIVAHHVEWSHQYFIKHRNWFGHLKLPDGRDNIRLWDEYRLTTWFDTFLPTFDYINSKAALEQSTSDAIWWLKITGADGFRQDAVKHIPNIFWRTLNRKLEKEIEIPDNKKIFQMGETFGSYDLVKSYVNNGQLPAQFNFNLYDVAIPSFINKDASFSLLDKEIKRGLYIFGENNLMGNIMDSQDKDRYMAYADSDLTINDPNSTEIGWNNPPKVHYKSSFNKERLYLAYLLSIPGVPTIYYGDEIGMTGAADPDNRRMMRFGNQLDNNEKENLSKVRNLIHLRDEHPALRYGDYFSLRADSNIFVYVRTDMNERVLVVLNKDTQSHDININLPEFYNAKYLSDLLNGNKISVTDNKAEIKVKGIGYCFYDIQ
jgi:glycosidase